MTNTIRKLTLAYLGFTIVLAISYFITPAYLPVELQLYLNKQWEVDVSTIELVGALALLIVAIVHLVSAVCIVFVKAWARKAFLLSTLLLYPLMPFMGPAVDHAITYTLDDISVLFLGMVVGLLLFTNDYQQTALNQALKQGRSDAAPLS